MISTRYSWIGLSVAGIVVLLLTATLQLSSVFTPLLARNPSLIEAVGSLGLILLSVASAFCLLTGISYRSWRYYVAGALFLIICLLIYYNPWATAFQLAFAGLTIGGSLLSLGCYTFYHQLKKSP